MPIQISTDPQRKNRGRRRRPTTAAMVSLVAVLLGSSSMVVVDVNAFHLPSRVPSPVVSFLSCSDQDNTCWRSPGALSEQHPQQIEQQYPQQQQQQQQQQHARNISRRGWLSRAPQTLAIITAAATSGALRPPPVLAAELGEVTDKVFVDVSGLSASASAETGSTQRIVLGLFGKDAPSSVQKIKLLFDTRGPGLQAPCKPLKEDFLIQREQLEANKIYRSCTEGQGRGVTYDYAQIWRIMKDERIDFGSLSGRFNAREYPTWAEKTTTPEASEYLSSDAKYLVAVRKGSDSGFGYALFPKATAGSNKDFLENHSVVGRVLEGDSVVDTINNVSVVASAKSFNYMSIVGVGGKGGATGNNAPKKDCRYGGPMYCNENKPLTKLTMFRSGIIE